MKSTKEVSIATRNIHNEGAAKKDRRLLDIVMLVATKQGVSNES